MSPYTLSVSRQSGRGARDQFSRATSGTSSNFIDFRGAINCQAMKGCWESRGIRSRAAAAGADQEYASNFSHRADERHVLELEVCR